VRLPVARPRLVFEPPVFGRPIRARGFEVVAILVEQIYGRAARDASNGPEIHGFDAFAAELRVLDVRGQPASAVKIFATSDGRQWEDLPALAGFGRTTFAAVA
jgi:hypothetical protein